MTPAAIKFDQVSREAENPVATKKVRLTFKEQQEYNTLEAEIEKLEKENHSLRPNSSSGTVGYEELTVKSERVGRAHQPNRDKTQPVD
ncbi:MAG: ABC transporter C-terminal domain-containing protein [Bacteroidales bacterium]